MFLFSDAYREIVIQENCQPSIALYSWVRIDDERTQLFNKYWTPTIPRLADQIFIKHVSVLDAMPHTVCSQMYSDMIPELRELMDNAECH